MNDPETRALLAGMAMQGLLANRSENHLTVEAIAKEAVSYADDILRRLEETEDKDANQQQA